MWITTSGHRTRTINVENASNVFAYEDMFFKIVFSKASEFEKQRIRAFIENKSGRLADIIEFLTNNNIDFRLKYRNINAPIQVKIKAIKCIVSIRMQMLVFRMQKMQV